MPIFEYRAVNEEGTAVRGTLVSASVATAAADLEKRGLKVDHVGLLENPNDPIPTEFGRTERTPTDRPKVDTSQRSYVQTHVVGQVIGRVPLSELLFFFRQSATMLHAGIGVPGMLDTLSNQNRDPKLRTILAEMKLATQEGIPMSATMQRYPEVFSTLMLGLIRAGEEGGKLVEVLQLCADYVDKEIKLRMLVKRLTFYPKMVLFASVIIIWSANAIIGMVGGEGIWSPLTQPSTWCLLLPVAGSVWVFNRLILPNPVMRQKWDHFTTMVPYVGRTVHQLAMAKFGRALAALYQGGVPIHKATLLAADACGNEHIRAGLYPAADALESGKGLWESFASTQVLDRISLDMIRTGEHTGNLDAMLDKIAEFYEGDCEVRVTVAANVLSVAVMIMVGIYVGIVVITFYMGRISAINAAGGP